MKLRAGNPMLKFRVPQGAVVHLPIDAQQIIRRQHNSLRELRDRVRRMQQETIFRCRRIRSLGDTGRRSMEKLFRSSWTERPMVSTMVAVRRRRGDRGSPHHAVRPQSITRYEDQSSGRYGGSDQFGKPALRRSDQFGSRRYGEEQFGNRTDRRLLNRGESTHSGGPSDEDPPDFIGSYKFFAPFH